MNEFIERVLTVDFDQISGLLRQVVESPLSNLQASLLVLAAFVVITLLAIVVAIYLIMYRMSDEAPGRTEGRFEPKAKSEPVGPVYGAAVEERERVALSPSERRTRMALTAASALGLIAVAWMLTGVTTAAEPMCVSCHRPDMPHAERLADESSATVDPHLQTSCVRCHEPGGLIAMVTTNVPARAIHYAAAMALPSGARGYGVPISSAACSSCHGDAIRKTVTVEDRGVKMSHKEPLAAGATCMDCHEMQAVSGAVGAWTIGMAPCLRCHDNERASAECSSCHTKDIAYAVHANNEPQPKRLVADIQCGTCHDQRKCDACHGIRMPHGEEFVRREHPREATLDIWYNDLQKCRKCHTSKRNPCSNCHIRAFPGHPIVWRESHGVNPEAGFTVACNGCHTMGALQGRNFCAICHDRYEKIR